MRQNMVVQVKKRPVVVLKNNQGNSVRVETKCLSSLSSCEDNKSEEKNSSQKQITKPERYEQKIGEKAKTTTLLHQSKPTNFNVRLDVVRKTIFRAMKKFYLTKFKEFYDFTQRKRKSSDDHCQEVLRQAESFARKELGDKFMEDISVFLVSLIDTKQKYSDCSDKYPQLGTQINSLLRSFNTKKAKSLLKFKEFATLVLHFLNNSANTEELLSDKEEECVQTYKSQIELLKQQCKDSLTYTQ